MAAQGSGRELPQLGDVLQRERDFFNAVIASMGEAVIVINEHGDVALLNPVAEYVLDVMFSKAKNRRWDEFFSIYKGEKELPAVENPISVALSVGEASLFGPDENVFLSLKKRSGKRVPVTLTVTPFLRGQGISGTVVLFRDITEERELTDAKSSFISIASHQLRVPLTTMRWFSEMLLDGDAGTLGEEQRDFVAAIETGTERLVSLLNTLLQMTRIEAGRLTVDPKPTDFKQLTEEVIMALQAPLKEKEQQIEILVAEDLPKIPMDQELLWQVIQNLLSNAIRYSPKGSVASVQIAFDKGTNELLYSVKDRGIGIPEHERVHIFDRFYRAPNAVKYAPEGNGLGLSFAKKLVESWSGKIWAESELGRGSTFFFTIPEQGMQATKGEVRMAF